MYYKNRIYFNDPHATERFIKWNVPKAEIRKVLKAGVIIDDLGHENRKLCICRLQGEFKTIVFQPIKNFVFIITCYPSKPDEERMYKERKRNDRNSHLPKM